MIKVKKREVARWKKDHISVSIFITRMEGKELYFILTKNHTDKASPFQNKMIIKAETVPK